MSRQRTEQPTRRRELITQRRKLEQQRERVRQRSERDARKRENEKKAHVQTPQSSDRGMASSSAKHVTTQQAAYSAALLVESDAGSSLKAAEARLDVAMHAAEREYPTADEQFEAIIALRVAQQQLREAQHACASACLAVVDAECSLVARKVTELRMVVRKWEQVHEKQSGHTPTEADRASNPQLVQVERKLKAAVTRHRMLERRRARAAHKEVAWPGQHWQRRSQMEALRTKPTVAGISMLAQDAGDDFSQEQQPRGDR